MFYKSSKGNLKNCPTFISIHILHMESDDVCVEVVGMML